MIYGLYLSAGGVLAQAHRQDVLANNLANVETTGFKRDLAMFVEQRTEAQLRGLSPWRHSDPILERLGGGLDHAPTAIDFAQGPIEPTGNDRDLAINGDGFFVVRDPGGSGQVRLTRDGRLAVDRDGYLRLASNGAMVLNDAFQPIAVKPGPMAVGPDGLITQDGRPAGRLALFDVADRRALRKTGGGLYAAPDLERALRPAGGTIAQKAVENANAEPATELAALLDAQRTLEANANMIRFQDQTLARLVNDVGKIG